MIQKIPIRTKKEAEEALAQMHIYDRKISRDDVPSVWVVQMPEVKGEQGQVYSIVNFTDFYGDDVFHQAQQILELLNGQTMWNDQIPVEAYPVVERALRRANLIRDKIGDYAVNLEDDARRAESLYSSMVDFKAIEYMEKQKEERVTVARMWARNQCSEYMEKMFDAKRMRDQAQNIEKSLSKTLSTFSSILAKLRREYEYIHLTASGTPSEQNI